MKQVDSSRFDELKKSFPERYNCLKNHVGNSHVTKGGLYLSCCASFNKTCTVDAFRQLEEQLINLCLEVDILREEKEQLRNEKIELEKEKVSLKRERNHLRQEREKRTEKGGVINVFNGCNFGTQNFTLTQAPLTPEQLYNVFKIAYEKNIPKKEKYSHITKLIGSCPESEKKSTFLKLVHSNKKEDTLDAEIAVLRSVQEYAEKCGNIEISKVVECEFAEVEQIAKANNIELY